MPRQFYTEGRIPVLGFSLSLLASTTPVWQRLLDSLRLWNWETHCPHLQPQPSLPTNLHPSAPYRQGPSQRYCSWSAVVRVSLYMVHGDTMDSGAFIALELTPHWRFQHSPSLHTGWFFLVSRLVPWPVWYANKLFPSLCVGVRV